jgi:hypothetical protein
MTASTSATATRRVRRYPDPRLGREGRQFRGRGERGRTGDGEGDDDWLVQSVLIPVHVAENEDEAREIPDRIVAKIAA